MRVTVCELNDAPGAFAREWEQLVAHVKAESSQLVLLPEIPFCSWFAVTDQFNAAVWQQAVAAHDEWLARLIELAPAVVLGSRPVNTSQERPFATIEIDLDEAERARSTYPRYVPE